MTDRAVECWLDSIVGELFWWGQGTKYKYRGTSSEISAPSLASSKNQQIGFGLFREDDSSDKEEIISPASLEKMQSLTAALAGLQIDVTWTFPFRQAATNEGLPLAIRERLRRLICAVCSLLVTCVPAAGRH